MENKCVCGSIMIYKLITERSDNGSIFLIEDGECSSDKIQDNGIHTNVYKIFSLIDWLMDGT